MKLEADGQHGRQILERALNFWRQSPHWQVHSRAHPDQEAFEGHVQGDRQMMSFMNGADQAYLSGRTAYLRGPMFQSAVLSPRVNVRRLASVTDGRWMTCDRVFFESRGHDLNVFDMFAKVFLFRPGSEMVSLTERSQDAGSNLELSVGGSPVLISAPASGDPTITAFGYFSGEINADLTYDATEESAFPHIEESETTSLNDVLRRIKKPIKKDLEMRAPTGLRVEAGQTDVGQFLVWSDLSSNARIRSAHDAELEVIEFLTADDPELLRHIDFDSYDLTLSVYADSQEAADQLRDHIRTLFRDH